MPYSAHSFRASLYIGNTCTRETIGVSGLVYYIDVCDHYWGYLLMRRKSCVW